MEQRYYYNWRKILRHINIVASHIFLSCLWHQIDRRRWAASSYSWVNSISELFFFFFLIFSRVLDRTGGNSRGGIFSYVIIYKTRIKFYTADDYIDVFIFLGRRRPRSRQTSMKMAPCGAHSRRVRMKRARSKLRSLSKCEKVLCDEIEWTRSTLILFNAEA